MPLKDRASIPILGLMFLAIGIAVLVALVPEKNVYWEFFSSSVQSPFSLECEFDSDCAQYTVVNQCKAYCGNADSENLDVAQRLDRNRVCDAGLWDKPDLNCRCIINKCIRTEAQ